MKRLITVAVVSMLVSTTATADWMDDWLTNANVKPGSSYQGDRRGYIEGGSVQMRWKSTSDHLFSVDPPRMSAGCNGIDMFMGGMSYMDPEYLVQHFQTIVASAPAMAFEMALDTMCTQCRTIMENLQHASEFLNGLQINDCQAAKKVVAAMDIKNAKSVSDVYDNMVTNGSAGIEQALTTAKNQYDALSKVSAPSGASTVSTVLHMAACPAMFKDVFFGGDPTEAIPGGGSVIKNAMAKFGYSDYEAEMRGLVGDVYMYYDAAQKQWTSKEIPPCSQNEGLSVRSFMDGQYYTRAEANYPTSQACTLVTSTNGSMEAYVRTQLNSIIGDIQSNTALSTSQKTFLDAIPIRLRTSLTNAVREGYGATVIDAYSDMVAVFYAYSSALDMNQRMGYIVDMVKEAALLPPSSDPLKCNKPIIAVALSEFEDMKLRLHRYEDRLHAEYAARLQNFANMQQINGVIEASDRRNRANIMAPAAASGGLR